MGKKRSRRSRGFTDRYVGLHHYMLDCPAWKALSPPAVKLLIAVWQRHNGMNNGEISFSVREAEAIGLSRSQAARAFGELKEKGFLRVVRDARFSTKTRMARTWLITDEPRGGERATKEFMVWTPRQEKREKQNTVSLKGRTVPSSGP